RLSGLDAELTGLRAGGDRAVELLDELLAALVDAATSGGRADGQSALQRIQQAMDRVTDLESDQDSQGRRAAWEMTADVGADQNLLDIAYRSLWQRTRGLSHRWQN